MKFTSSSNIVTLLQQNDTHGYLHPHYELLWHFPENQYRLMGGFSRIAAYAKRLRNTMQNVLFVDGGDLFHGTGPLVLSQGEAVIPLINAMGIDIFVPGNWDFAYGPARLQELVQQMSGQTIACNVFESETGNPLFTPYVVKEMTGFRVGVIGLTYPFVNDTMPPAFSKGLEFRIGVEEVQNHIEQLKLKEKADLILLVSHMGLPLDLKLASLIHGIDVILSGHSHDRIQKPIVQNNTLLIQSGASGSFLGQLDLTIESGKISDYKHRLLPVYSDEWAFDEQIEQAALAVAAQYAPILSPVVGRTGSYLHRMTLNEAPMDKLITDAYLFHTGADLAFSHGWRYGAPIVPGPVTVKDLYQIIPTNPELFEIELDGETILEALEKNLEQVFAADPFQQKGGYILRSSGLFVAYKPYNGKGKRIEYAEIQGKPLDLGKTYRITGAGEQIFKGVASDRKLLGKSSHEVLTAYFASASEVTVDSLQRIVSI